MPVVHFPFSDQEIEVASRGIGRTGHLELALRVEFHFGNRDTFVRRQLFAFRRSKMGKRQDQTDDQAISRTESVSHRSTLKIKLAVANRPRCCMSGGLRSDGVLHKRLDTGTPRAETFDATVAKRGTFMLAREDLTKRRSATPSGSGAELE